MPVTPTLRLERRCWQAGEQVVVGIDEVGRGAWAGPVTVGAVVSAPEHLRGYGPSAIHRRSWIFMDYCLWGGIVKYEREPRLF